MTVLRRLATVGCVVVVACGPAPQAAEPTPTRRMLVEEEIRGAQVSTAYQVVARLRPEWLRRRGRISVRDRTAGNVVVYLNGLRQGDASALDAIVAETVLEMEYLNGQEATTRFGTGHGGGVILVRLR